MVRIAHISDIHFGRISHPAIVQALIDDINSSDVDLVVASGDLTQRAFGHQFRAARRMLAAFDAPTLAVPGNHDVFPWWRIFSRLLDPLRRFRKIISEDLAPEVHLEGATVKGINSAFGWTIQGGRVTEKELNQIRTGFDLAAPDDIRILVVHHHLAKLDGLGDHDMVQGAEEALSAALGARVELVLSGHLHVSHAVEVELEGEKLVVASSGTSTSSRGRGKDKASNYYNLIEIEDLSIAIDERRFDPEAQVFIPQKRQLFERNAGRASIML